MRAGLARLLAIESQFPQQFQITYRSPESSLLGGVERLKRCRVVTAELGEFIGD
jgi:hypothetical protein